MCKISVVIPLYNKESSIKETIYSVLSQSFRDFEIVIVDDGSSDASLSVVQSINDERIKLIKKNNAGVSSARNAGVINATGQYVFFLDADDVILDNCLRELLDLVNEYPEANVVTANFIYKDEHRKTFNYCKGKFIGMVEDPLKEHYFRNIYLRTGNMLVRRDCFETVGFFDEQLSKFEDLEFSIRLIKNFRIAYSPSVVFEYCRKHSSLSTNKMDINKEFASKVDFTGKGFYERLSLGEHVASTVYTKFFVEKDHKSSFYLIKKNIRSIHYIVFCYGLLKLKGLINHLR